MACPTCGGSNRQALALGFYRCTSSVPYSWTENEVAGAPLWNGVVPTRTVTKTAYRSCGTEYQEADASMSASIPQCSCGLFSVGLCSDCQKPTCGQHGGMIENAWRCTEHVRAVKLEQMYAVQAQKADQLQHERERAEADSQRLEDKRQQILAAMNFDELPFYVPNEPITSDVWWDAIIRITIATSTPKYDRYDILIHSRYKKRWVERKLYAVRNCNEKLWHIEVPQEISKGTLSSVTWDRSVAFTEGGHLYTMHPPDAMLLPKRLPESKSWQTDTYQYAIAGDPAVSLREHETASSNGRCTVPV